MNHNALGLKARLESYILCNSIYIILGKRPDWGQRNQWLPGAGSGRGINYQDRKRTSGDDRTILDLLVVATQLYVFSTHTDLYTKIEFYCI